MVGISFFKSSAGQQFGRAERDEFKYASITSRGLNKFHIESHDFERRDLKPGSSEKVS